jgi:MFS family permease
MSINDPIIPPVLIYDKHVLKVLVALAFGYAVFTGFILLPLFADTALFVIIPAFLAAIFSSFAGKKMDMQGGRIITCIGALMMVLASILMLITGMSQISFLFFLGLITLGVAFGTFQGPASGRVIVVSPKEWYALASVFMSMSIYLGASVGTALFSAFDLYYIHGGCVVSFPWEWDAPGWTWGWTAVCIVCIIVSIIALYNEWVVPDDTMHSH